MEIDLRKKSRLSPKDAFLLNQIAKELRPVYNDFVKQIGEYQTNRLFFWSTEMASRNTFSSDIFYKIVQIRFVHFLISSNSTIKTIYTDCPILKMLLKKSISPKIRLVYKRSITEKISYTFKPLANYLEWSLKLGLQFLFAKLTAGKQHNSIPENSTLIDTFIFNHSFQNGDFEDRYYDNMLDIPEEKIACCYVPTFIDINLFNYPRIFKAIRKSKKKIILIEDMLSFQDIISIIYFPFSYKIKSTKIVFDNLDIFPLFKKLLNEKKGIQLIAYSKYLFFKKIRKHEISPRIIIDWFEGQVIDKLWQAGANEFFKNTPKISYQIASNHEFYLCYYPTDYEFESRVLADVLYTSGKGFVNEVSSFSKKTEFKVAPAFRYQHLYQKTEKPSKTGKYQVLVGFSFLVSDCLDILDVLNGINLKDFDILFKVHPALTEQNLKKAYSGSWKERKFVSGDFNILLEKSDLLISTNSSTCLEAVARGTPVIIIGSRSGLTQNPIPQSVSSKIWRVVYTSEELDQALNYFMNLSDDQKAELEQIGHQVREDYFEPVTREATRKFLMLDEE